MLEANQTTKTWGWRKNPFTLQPNPDFLVDFENEAKDLLFSVMNGAHSMILGDLGTGKTTILLWLSKALQNKYYALYFSEPPEDLIKSIENELRKQGAFGFWDALIPVKLTHDKLPKIRKPVVLLIDEAHEMNASTANELKLLADKEKLVIILAGQFGVEKRIKKNKALDDRIVTRINLEPMSTAAISTMIESRIKGVGGQTLQPFNEVVLKEIAARSEGNPREALKICNVVLNAVLAGEKLE